MRAKAIILAALLPLAAAAQESAPPMPENPRAPRFDEVERGFFTGFEVGYLTLFKTPVADPTKFAYVKDPITGAPRAGGRSDGFMVGTTVGYDVTDRLALAIYGLGASSAAGPWYGSFSMFSFGGDARVALLGARDANRVERFYLYLHGRAGYLVSFPSGLFTTHDLYVAGGPGIEYFTHLRHFSIGLAADVAYVMNAKAAGLAVTPTVRYTF